MAILFLLSAIFGCVLAPSPTNVVKPVELTLYYESLCSGSRVFMQRHLFPVFAERKYYSLITKLTLVPYGVVIFNETTHQYRCQCDPGDCDGNRFHACAIKYIADDLMTVNYFACLANKTSDWSPVSYVYPVDACQDILPEGAYSKIMNCYNSDEGLKLFEAYGNKTNTFLDKNGFIPYVSFNGTRDDLTAIYAIVDLKATLCQLTEGC